MIFVSQNACIGTYLFKVVLGTGYSFIQKYECNTTTGLIFSERVVVCGYLLWRSKNLPYTLYKRRASIEFWKSLFAEHFRTIIYCYKKTGCYVLYGDRLPRCFTLSKLLFATCFLYLLDRGSGLRNAPDTNISSEEWRVTLYLRLDPSWFKRSFS